MVNIETADIHNIIIDWLRETGVKDVALNTERIEGKHVLIIYAEHPGYLIGKAGCICDKYIPLIKEAGRFDEVDLKQIVSITRMEDSKINPERWLNDYFMSRGF